MNPYKNPDGSLNEDALLAALLAYRGDNPVILGAQKAARELIEAEASELRQQEPLKRIREIDDTEEHLSRV